MQELTDLASSENRCESRFSHLLASLEGRVSHSGACNYTTCIFAMTVLRCSLWSVRGCKSKRHLTAVLSAYCMSVQKPSFDSSPTTNAEASELLAVDPADKCLPVTNNQKRPVRSESPNANRPLPLILPVEPVCVMCNLEAAHIYPSFPKSMLVVKWEYGSSCFDPFSTDVVPGCYFIRS